MEKNELIVDLKKLLVRLLEQEQDAIDAGNILHLNGLQWARVNLESTLESHGIARTTTLDNVEACNMSAKVITC